MTRSDESDADGQRSEPDARRSTARREESVRRGRRAVVVAALFGGCLSGGSETDRATTDATASRSRTESVGTDLPTDAADTRSSTAQSQTAQSQPPRSPASSADGTNGETTRSTTRPATDGGTPTDTPRQNQTPYPVAFPSAEGGPFHDRRVSLSPERGAVRLARTRTEWGRLQRAIDDAVRGSFDGDAFADRTAFDTESLVFVETTTPSVPARLFLRAVDGVGTDAVTLHVFCSLGAANAEGHRTLFVRLPHDGQPPERVVVQCLYEGDDEPVVFTTRAGTDG